MSKKLTKEEFINKCNVVHNYKYDYSLVNYIDAKTKIDIICPIHGIFKQEAYSHKSGIKCSKCTNNYKLSNTEFIKKAIEIHGDKYDYSLVDYKNNNTKIKIICKNHGIFEQTPSSHLNNYECKKCKNSKNDNFYEIASNIHSNKYDYSLVDLTKKTIKIICPIHGEFEQGKYNHLKGHGCSKCKNLYNYDTAEFIKKSKEIHGNKYDYSLSIYKNATTNIKIKCKYHNFIFNQSPNSHLSGSGCPKCANNVKFSTDEFIKKSKEIHCNKYDYSLSIYKNNYTKVKIICNKHDVFEQNPKNHKNGANCPYCIESKGEKEILKELKKLNIKYIRQKKFKDCKNKKELPFDFYLPYYNTCIEFDGRQHFEPVNDFGGEQEFFKIKNRDKIKNNYCKNNNINLIRIKYDQKIVKILNDNFKLY